MKPSIQLTILSSILASAPFASAATLAIGVGANSSIRVSTDNQGASEILFAGDTTSDFLRSAVAFDLSNPLLTGATINSATVTFTVRGADGTSQNASMTLNLHQLSSSFANGDGTVGSGVTWTSRDGTNNWSTAGGDFGGVLASNSGNPRTASRGDTMDFSSTSLASAVEGAIGGNLYLLLKSNTEDQTNRNLFQFASTRNTLQLNNVVVPGPVLTIDYTPIPEPSSALIGGLCIIALLRRRR